MDKKRHFAEFQRSYGLALSEEQAEACRDTEGQLLLLAVPGSGKTAVTVARLGYLVKGLGVSPDAILAVTYSVAGANEMQRRYERLFGGHEIEIRTIHGVCAKILYLYGRLYRRHTFRLMTGEGEGTALLKAILNAEGDYPTENELRDLRTAITYCRNRLMTDEEIEKEMVFDGRDFLSIYRRFLSVKEERRIMDYDDQLCYAYRVMKRCPDVLDAYAGRLRYLLVDEAQDTSLIQHKILELLASRCRNLFMVGDEDQSIYGFRAAYPEALLNFEKTYPEGKVKGLTKNYRSTGTIVEAAWRFIGKNRDRRTEDKAMGTDNPAGKPILHTALADLNELPTVLVTAAREGGENAALFRFHDTMLPTVDRLLKEGLPFRLRGSDPLFFTHFIVSDVVSLLRFADDPFDEALFEALYYKLSCGFTRGECEAAIRQNRGEKRLSFPEYLAGADFLSDSKRKAAKKLDEMLYKIRQADTYEALRLIFFSSGYRRYLEHKTTDAVKRNTLLSLAYQNRGRKDFYGALEDLRAVVTEGSKGEGGLILSTIHSAKGMEFDRVFLCDAVNGVLPSVFSPKNGKSYDEEERTVREEERRLFYVAVTRAKNELILLSFKKEHGLEADGFEFIYDLLGKKQREIPLTPTEKRALYQKEEQERRSFEIEREMTRYEAGVCVRHKLFGEGVVLGRRGEFVEVQFHAHRFPKRLDLFLCLSEGWLTEA